MSIPGRKPKPTEEKRRAGNPGHRPLNDNEPQPTKGAPPKPEHLDEMASQMWDDLCKELGQMGILATSDQVILAMFCDSWSLYVDACNMIKQGSQIYIAPMKEPKQAAWVSVRATAVKQLLQCASELGLSPTSRARLSVPSKPQSPEGKGRFFKVVG